MIVVLGVRYLGPYILRTHHAHIWERVIFSQSLSNRLKFIKSVLVFNVMVSKWKRIIFLLLEYFSFLDILFSIIKKKKMCNLLRIKLSDKNVKNILWTSLILRYYLEYKLPYIVSVSFKLHTFLMWRNVSQNKYIFFCSLYSVRGSVPLSFVQISRHRRCVTVGIGTVMCDIVQVLTVRNMILITTILYVYVDSMRNAQATTDTLLRAAETKSSL